MADEKIKGKLPAQKAEPETEFNFVLPGDGSQADDGELVDDDEAGLETDDHQAAEIREIFGTAFPQYLQPVEEVVEQILSGEGDPDSVEALTGMVASLMEASSRMGFEDVGERLSQLQEHIFTLDLHIGGDIPSETREGILGTIMDLKDMAEEMGGGAPAGGPTPPEERSQTIISALKDKEDVGKLVLKKLSAAGLITVDQLLMARPDEIAAVAGLDIEVVSTILGHIRPKAAAPSVPAVTPGSVDEETPAEVEALHEKVLQRLRNEADIEASVEELKVEIRSLRSRIFEYRAELKSLDISLGQKAKAWGQFSEQMAHRAEILEELRARRDALVRRYSASEQVVQKKELVLHALKEERRKIEAEAVNLSRAVNSLVEKVSRVRRAVARRQLV